MNSLYEQISNPLESEENIDKVIDAAAKKEHMYFSLVSFGTKTDNSKINRREEAKFKLLMFTVWKKSISYHRNNNSYRKSPTMQKEIVRLDDFLKRFNPKSIQDIDELYDGTNIQDESLKKIIQKHYWKSDSLDGWTHIENRNLKVNSQKRDAVEHRLYLNCNRATIHLVISKFVSECLKKNLNFYFKFSDSCNRDDSIVIYSPSKDIEKYVEILRKIKRENNISEGLGEPPFITGKIDGWIGYGSNPDKDLSYNLVRANHLERCVEEEVIDWMQGHLNSRIRINGKETSYRALLANDIVRKKINELKETEVYSKTRPGSIYNDLDSKEFKNKLLHEVYQNLEKMLEGYKKQISIIEPAKQENPYPLKVDWKGKKIIFCDYNDVIKDHLGVIRKTKGFKEKLVRRIKKTAHEYGIDGENYAVDLSRKTDLQNSSGGEKGRAPQNDVGTSQPRANKPATTPNIEDDIKSGKIVFDYKPMTDAEIEQARKNIGF